LAEKDDTEVLRRWPKHVVGTIVSKGFTERQARFLVLVARHSGACVMRQYSTFAVLGVLPH
jgi:hypothetical protein